MAASSRAAYAELHPDADKQRWNRMLRCSPPPRLPTAHPAPRKRKPEQDVLECRTVWDLLTPAAKRTRGLEYLQEVQKRKALESSSLGRTIEDYTVKVPRFRAPFAMRGLEVPAVRRMEEIRPRALLPVLVPWDSMSVHASRDVKGAGASSDALNESCIEEERRKQEIFHLGWQNPRAGKEADNGAGKVEEEREYVSGKAKDGEGQEEGRDPRPAWKKLLDKVAPPDDGRETELQLLMKKLEAVQLNSQAVLNKWIFKKKVKESFIPVDSAIAPLSAEAEEAVEAALSRRGVDLLVEHKETNIAITRDMMQCLLPGEWLNDEVINLYLALLKEREVRNAKKRLTCHFFNTFFYNKLYSDRRQYDYKGVRRWTTQKRLGYTLMDCDKIIVPVHQQIHWTVAVINIRDQRLEFFDSLRGPDNGCLDNLARYIMDDAKDKCGVNLDVRSWPRTCPEDIPLQLNGCDCGVFMVKYADYQSRDAPLTFDQKHMNYFRRRMVWELLRLQAED